jgi:hypothetical protein
MLLRRRPMVLRSKSMHFRSMVSQCIWELNQCI